MGGSSSHSVSETIKKNQEYISDMNKIKVRDKRLMVGHNRSFNYKKINSIRCRVMKLFSLFDKFML